MYRIGVDIGGTFTDFVLMDDLRREIAIHKRLTTPLDPSSAVLDGIDHVLAERSVPISDVEAVVHGSTLVTNAVIERRGAVTGMLVTRGFKDVLDIGLERRYDLYDMRIRYPEPLIPRSHRIEVSERVDVDGAVIHPLDESEVRAAIETLGKRHSIEALAVCFLHSFTNPSHEEDVRRIASSAHPELYVSTSADVLPYAREYERWTTTTINAFTQPMVDRYLMHLEQGLADRGFRGRTHIMTSSGGSVTTDTARRYPVRMLESGPAAGVLMSAHHGRELGLQNILSFDMGGTTAKGSIIRKGEPDRVYEIEVARVHEFRLGSGLPVRIPVVDMIEIGAGGGSIAEVDDRNLIRVGPRSAGAAPGPACYGRGGRQPTLTDANLVLGYYDPEFFLGGTMALDGAAAEHALRERIAVPLNLDLARAAWGVHEIINEDVARAFRVHASEIGFDYRSSTMIGFGGSGPAHAVRIARKLRIPRVVLPVASGVMSALGMLVSPVSFHLARTHIAVLEDLDPATLANILSRLELEASGFLLDAGVRKEEINVVRRIDVRYLGQGHEIEVTLPDVPGSAYDISTVQRLFSEEYRNVFSISYIDEPIEIVTWKVEVSGPRPATTQYKLTGPDGTRGAQKSGRRAFFPEAGGYVDCPVYNRYSIVPGETIAGPALIEERESTCVIGVGDVAQVDGRGNLVVQLEFGTGAA